MYDTQVGYLQEPLSHHFQPLIHISITTGPISIKFTYFMPAIYTTLHTKFEENQLSSLRVKLGNTQNFKTVRYFIKYHGINNYHGI